MATSRSRSRRRRTWELRSAAPRRPRRNPRTVMSCPAGACLRHPPRAPRPRRCARPWRQRRCCTPTRWTRPSRCVTTPSRRQRSCTRSQRQRSLPQPPPRRCRALRVAPRPRRIRLGATRRRRSRRRHPRARCGSRQSPCRVKRSSAGRGPLGLPHPSSTQARRGRTGAEQRGTAASVASMSTTPLGMRAGGARRRRRGPLEKSSTVEATGSITHPTAGHQPSMATGLGPHLAGVCTRSREPCRSIWRGQDRGQGTGRERATAHAEGSGMGTEADPPQVSGMGHRANIDRPLSPAERATLS